MPNDNLDPGYVPAVPGGATLANLFGKRPESPKPAPEAPPEPDSPRSRAAGPIEVINMARVIPKEIERQLAGLRGMTSHAERLYRQGIISADELEHARTYAVEQRFGPLMDTETYIAARQSGLR
jgi:hypothetical protein